MIDKYENAYRQDAQIRSTVSQKLIAALPSVIDSFKSSYNLKSYEKIETVTYNLMNMTAYTNVPLLKQAVYDFAEILDSDREMETEELTVTYKQILKEAQKVIKRFKN